MLTQYTEARAQWNPPNYINTLQLSTSCTTLHLMSLSSLQHKHAHPCVCMHTHTQQWHTRTQAKHSLIQSPEEKRWVLRADLNDAKMGLEGRFTWCYGLNSHNAPMSDINYRISNMRSHAYIHTSGFGSVHVHTRGFGTVSYFSLSLTLTESDSGEISGRAKSM